MTKFTFAFFFILCFWGHAQTLKVLYMKGKVNSVSPKDAKNLHGGDIINNKNIIKLDTSSQIIYTDGIRCVKLNTAGSYTHSQLITILNSKDGDILSRYVNYIFPEITNHSGEVIFDKIIGTERNISLDSAIISDTIVNFIRNLQVNDSAFYSAIEIVPVTTKKVKQNIEINKKLPITKLMDKNSRIIITAKDTFIATITNKSNQLLYFILLDIQPNNKMNMLFPENMRKYEDFRLEPGTSWESPVCLASFPYGTEVLKLIATKLPINITSIISICITATSEKVIPNSFEKLFAEYFKSYLSNTNDLNTYNSHSGLIGIYSLSFETKP